MKAMCVRKGQACAVVLAPVPNGGLKVLAPASYLVDGNFGVRLKRGNGEVFVWKKSEIAATPERLEELAKFRGELMEFLSWSRDGNYVEPQHIVTDGFCGFPYGSAVV